MEQGAGLPEPASPRDIARGLIEAEEFEAFLARKFPTKKRFGAEGAEAIVPLLRRLLEGAARAGIRTVVIGSMHRGRLSIVANVLRRPLARMLAELKTAHPFPADSPRAADVPYHLGHRTTLRFGEAELDVILLPNPSHLEAVDPLVLGRARAEQDRLGSGGAARVLPLILHTDAAVVGQGVVAECIQLAGTAGYGTGGALHVVVNNRIGFTTEPEEARTSRHCTGPWKAVDSAILHVNGDDPAAACRAADIALAWRQAQGRDAVIDLVCYRRNGHNEIDEPGFTQPVRHARIAEHPSVRAQVCAALSSSGDVPADELDAFAKACRTALQAAYEASESAGTNASGYVPNPPPAEA
ncbi:MAG: Oxoglutarate dehydrogenase (succinyl-transferring), partial [Actinomycetospora chiangmaiensis]|nr:Oxoglutarate dehydrogenase (succinyl-transferring) [Actinomycetospora chiangmaiensis]